MFFLQDLGALWCKNVCYKDCHQCNMYMSLLNMIYCSQKEGGPLKTNDAYTN